MSAREYLDDDRRGAAVFADKGRRSGIRRCVIAGVNDCRSVQQRTYARQILPPHRIRKQPIVTDAVEATRQHVQQESTHELTGLERHGLVAGAPPGAVILPVEGHAAFIERDEALVGDGNACGTSGRVRPRADDRR
jgi:hypothetical protein